MKTENVLLRPEEEVKLKVIVPYLGSLGFSWDEVSFEEGIDARFGKKIIGRADIMCKSKIDSKNLFVIEVKADSVKICDNDIEQGLSYARLAHPIAPFVIITNGKETLVIDTITKTEISGNEIGNKSNFWKNGCKLAVNDELELRYEALQNFIGYCPENLNLFSTAQVERRMQMIKGDSTELHKKYIPQIFVDRQEVVEQFDEFLTDETVCFALIGEAGVGKTNVICNLSESYLDKNIVLFFNAVDIATSIVEYIKADFNWLFSPQLDAPEIIKRLDTLAERAKIKTCIFIDAIDESPAPNFIQDINDFVFRLKDFNNVKLCISCKDKEWNRFIHYKGTPTFISENCYKPKEKKVQVIDREKTAVLKNEPGFFIHRFNDAEEKSIDAKYRSLFKYKGELVGGVKKECRLGFMMRVVAEVYENQEIPRTIDDADLLRRYLNKKLEKLDEEIARNCLEEIGRALFDAEISVSNKEQGLSSRIEESDLRRRLRLAPNEKLPVELFSYNILTRTTEEEGLRYVGFYHTKLRDYVVATYSLKLQTLDNQALKKLIPDMLKGPVGQGAINWYFQNATEEHNELLLGYHYEKGLLFLNEYKRIIEKNMPLLKKQFKPCSSHEIGLMIVYNIVTGTYFYGFRPCDEKENEAPLLFQVYIVGDDIHDMFFRNNVRHFCSRSENAFIVDPIAAARQEIKEQLHQIIENGRLNESNNIGLAKEKAIAIIYNYSKKLGFKKIQKDWVPRIYHLLPLNCDDILSRIKFIHAKDYYYNKTVNEKIESGEIPSERNESRVTAHINHNQINFKEIEGKARYAVESNIPIPEPNVIGDIQIFSALADAINTIKKESGVLKETLLPPPDIPFDKIIKRVDEKGGIRNYIPDNVIAQYSDNQIKRYVEEFFKVFFEEYRILVETNFPTIENKISFPNCVYVEAVNNRERGGVMTYSLKYDDSESKTTVVLNPEESRIYCEDSEFASWCGCGLASILWTSRSVPLAVSSSTSHASDFSSVSDMCTLRSFVYERTKANMKMILESVVVN